MKAIINKINGIEWACCGHCKHKLGKIKKTYNECDNCTHSDVQVVTMEIKCTSCKEINEIEIRGGRNGQRVQF